MNEDQYVGETLHLLDRETWEIYSASNDRVRQAITKAFILGESTRAEAQRKVFDIYFLSRYLYRLALRCLSLKL
jgi:hypothetical protein